MTPGQLESLRRRLYSRFPLIGGWVRRAAARKLAANHSLGAVRILAQAVADTRDAKVRCIALKFLPGLTRSDHMDAVVQTWADTRNPELEGLMRWGLWVANRPPAVRVLSALKLEKPLLIAQGDADLAPALVAAAEDQDAQIADLARQTLRRLMTPAAQEALCQLVIHHDSEQARQAALDAGYLPEDPRQRALFYFITEQWESYQAIDFDRSVLRAVHEAAGPELRRRILERLRRAGRVDYLTVLAGADYRSRAADLSKEEADFLLRLLAENQEWDKVWSLALSLMPVHVAQALNWLAANDWQPEMAEERELLQSLRAALPGDESLSADTLRQILPPAVRRAQARVPGRINDLAFHADRPLLAVGTGQRKVVLWDYQRGERVSVLSGLEHSVGRVALAGDVVLCAERGVGLVECAVWAWTDGTPFKLGAHMGPVTSLEPFDGRLLTTGRDWRAVVWQLDRRGVETERRLHFWPRSARVSPSGKRVALLHDGVSLLALPTLQPVGDVRGAGHRGVARCAAFGPDGQGVVIGRHNGQVVTIGHVAQTPSKVKSSLVYQHAGPVIGVEFLPRRQLILSAGGGGSVRFTPWPDDEGAVLLPHNEIRIDSSTLTSLHVSPDGAYMAVGDASARLWLWDLRVLDVPGLFEQPLARSTPGHLATVNSLLESLPLPPQAEAALRFLERLLRFRFRHEIDIDEISTIKMGEFDIEIE